MEADLADRGPVGHPHADAAVAPVPTTRGLTEADRRHRTKALRLIMFAALMELVLILPFVDHLADAHPTFHFTQHGFIFLGGVLMGIALRDAYRLSHP